MAVYMFVPLALILGLQLKQPVAWLHIPKTGTSFVNAVMSLACDPGWDRWLGRELGHLFWARVEMARGCAAGFTSSRNVARKAAAFRATAAGLPVPSTWYRAPPGHLGFARWADSNGPLAVTVLRQPEQRLLSGFHAGMHGWRERTRDAGPLTYARKLQGCQVRFLTRGGDQCDSREQPPTTAEVQRAIFLLKRFQFVGIAEEWDLTICLWHRMFGGGRVAPNGTALPWWGACNATQFRNTRPTGVPLAVDQAATLHAATARDVSVLGDFRDEADRRLYAIGRMLFQRRLAEFNVTHAACAPCFRARDAAPAPAPRRASTGTSSQRGQKPPPKRPRQPRTAGP
ncbi:hypothetical protein KFE25_011523 [Diacronema lutheri]|uniref:Sulfotransferase n=2 Tax=Diacronema lutheri TaxID=2081491 RepID=A0A8J5XE00_DIALT|nr:hypothetical protein KFE25_011523 [Diacronema lutheri]